MAKVLLDTNIILDYLSASRPQHGDAVTLLEGLFDTPGAEVAVAASSLKDAYYILCRMYHNEPLVRDRLQAFAEIMSVEDLTKDIINDAFFSNEPDFEDGIIRATAEIAGVDAIITRDERAYKKSFVPAMTAHEYSRKFSLQVS